MILEYRVLFWCVYYRVVVAVLFIPSASDYLILTRKSSQLCYGCWNFSIVYFVIALICYNYKLALIWTIIPQIQDRIVPQTIIVPCSHTYYESYMHGTIIVYGRILSCTNLRQDAKPKLQLVSQCSNIINSMGVVWKSILPIQ